MKIIHSKLPFLVMVLAVCWIITACSSDNDNNSGITGNNSSAPKTFHITVTNITNNQPISPAAVVIHSAGYVAWRTGEPVSVPFEILAEGGNPSDFIQAAQDDPNVLAATTGSGVIMPGTSDGVELRVASAAEMFLSIATMLVNTNDAFTGIDNRSLDGIDVGQSVSILVPSYDAGTESNTEDRVSIPGPAAGGEGFNAVRDDSDHVHVHPGVVSAQDGLGGSVLDASHRWDNPVAKIVISRTG